MGVRFLGAREAGGFLRPTSTSQLPDFPDRAKTTAPLSRDPPLPYSTPSVFFFRVEKGEASRGSMGKGLAFKKKEREMALRHRRNGKSYRAIAEALGRSVAAVYGVIAGGSGKKTLGRPAAYTVRTKKAFARHVERAQVASRGRYVPFSAGRRGQVGMWCACAFPLSFCCRYMLTVCAACRCADAYFLLR